MKKLILVLIVFLCGITVHAEEEPENLHAQSAVLMDAESGRVLFEKNGDDIKPMASTTKIMTCIVALEKCNGDTVVTFSENADRQPKVHLSASSGEQFYLKDLLYSLMLESHNDTAVAIAEAVAGSEEAFANLMNQKAKEIGCKNTYFITPNGLDATDSVGKHSTTAIDLSKIMSYCILKSSQKEKFLEITSAAAHSFTNISGSRAYSCTNHNAFLQMMGEAISGKTGYTSEAGYCYVGAVESEGRTFVISLLACGWPNNKNYKWQDMKKIATYAMENYDYEEVEIPKSLETIPVMDGIPYTDELFGEVSVNTEIRKDAELSVLKRHDEVIEVCVEQEKELKAPVLKGTVVGKVECFLDGDSLAEYPIVASGTVIKKDLRWYWGKLIEEFYDL